MARPLRVVSFGECMLELQGEAFGAMRQGFGGDTLNTAVYLSRCARPGLLEVCYATALGDDALSDGMLRRWHDEALDTSLVRRLAGRLPGLYLIEVDGDGERRFSYWRERSAAREYFDAAAGQTPLELDEARIDALHFSGISLAILPPEGAQRLLALARRLRERGALVAFDNNFRPRLWPDVQRARELFGHALEVCSVALLTLDDEQALWGGTSTQAQLADSLGRPCPEVVVKRGALPTLLRCGRSPVREVPTVRVDRVLDTTAAGDAFAGGYLAERLAGGSAVQAAAAGNLVAARVVQHRGALIPRELMADLMGS